MVGNDISLYGKSVDFCGLDDYFGMSAISGCIHKIGSSNVEKY